MKVFVEWICLEKYASIDDNKKRIEFINQDGATVWNLILIAIRAMMGISPLMRISPS